MIIGKETVKPVNVPAIRNGTGEIVSNYEARVDLKWSLWSAHKATWEDYAPGVWDWAREWFNASLDDGNPESAGLSDAPRVIHTAPWKEIRFGTVAFMPGFAIVHFWDDEGPGLDFMELVEADTFAHLMRKIDAVEARLIRAGG